jgi:hypothetical protein
VTGRRSRRRSDGWRPAGAPRGAIGGRRAAERVGDLGAQRLRREHLDVRPEAQDPVRELGGPAHGHREHRRAVGPLDELLGAMDAARLQERDALRAADQQLDLRLGALDDAERPLHVRRRRIAGRILEALGQPLDGPQPLHREIDQLAVLVAASEHVEPAAIERERVRIEEMGRRRLVVFPPWARVLDAHGALVDETLQDLAEHVVGRRVVLHQVRDGVELVLEAAEAAAGVGRQHRVEAAPQRRHVVFQDGAVEELQDARREVEAERLVGVRAGRLALVAQAQDALLAARHDLDERLAVAVEQRFAQHLHVARDGALADAELALDVAVAPAPRPLRQAEHETRDARPRTVGRGSRPLRRPPLHREPGPGMSCGSTLAV